MGPIARLKRTEPAQTQISFNQSQEMAAHWAISLATNPLRPLSVPSTNDLHSPDRNGMLDEISYKPPKQDLALDYVEWSESPLHEAFKQSLSVEREFQQDPEAGEAGMTLFAIEDQLERTHVDLRKLLDDRANRTKSISSAAWVDRCYVVLEDLMDEMLVPGKWRQLALKKGANSSEADALADHASEILAYRDTTVRIIGGLADRDRVLAAQAEEGSEIP